MESSRRTHVLLQIAKLLLGGWLIIGNWIYLFSDFNPMLVPNLIIGAIFVLMALVNLWRIYRGKGMVGSPKV